MVLWLKPRKSRSSPELNPETHKNRNLTADYGGFFVDLFSFICNLYNCKGILMKEEPEPDSSIRKINRHAQFALINHEKYKYNDLCILFMDGTCLWRDGNIQVGLHKYPMSRITKFMVKRRYNKLYHKENNFLHAVFRHLVMTSTVSGLVLIGMSVGKTNKENNNQIKPATTVQNTYEQTQSQVNNLCDSITKFQSR